MLQNDLLPRLAAMPADTPLSAAHVAALHHAGLAPDPLSTLKGVPADRLDAWRLPAETHTVHAAEPPPRYRLGAVLAGLADAAPGVHSDSPYDAARLQTAFPLFTYADGAEDDFLTSLRHAEDPVDFRILRIPAPFDLPEDPQAPDTQAFLDALRRDPDAAVAAAQRLPARLLETFNPANWLLAEMARPTLQAAHLHQVAESISLLSDDDLGQGVNAYGHAETLQGGLVTRLSFTMSHLVAGLTQSSRFLDGSSSGYAALVTTLIKLGADFALDNHAGQNAMQVAEAVRHRHVSSPFLNLIDKFLLVQQLDDMLLHGDDENADKI
ncbi:hypothetical protein [Pigmentiphaga litoralis]|uniref:Ankyrin repeat domain-containing protein n=1 Tax=Pigmentiphaga litoralis TaxID=516702 RepID=A0A7Y9IUG5_9BURK|nr:hypothetical protein [Pigmentiphaga litoralis]NYE23094.1 hypothetical protein [Pigmentiphaga litoralis]NYE83291.1 hypothetical protein [Pigmentiphaga litoralis]